MFRLLTGSVSLLFACSICRVGNIPFGGPVKACSCYRPSGTLGTILSSTANLIVNLLQVTHYNNPKILAEVSEDLGEAMVGLTM